MQNVHDILKTILFGGSIDDKLAGAALTEALDWSVPSALKNLQLPEKPARAGVLDEKGLKKSTQKNGGFPKKSELKNESARGRLLHFFANHELLAIETMAYTLLKFPDAPLEFKQGVFKTLRDEQRHLGQYLERMREFGVGMGEVPLSFYFWKSLQSMASPLDFVTRMSLTFEQANLDFALEYARVFEQEVDDAKTASLLRQVHDDEVKHVAHGLKWFKEWKREDESEWEAYKKNLPFPLTPRRAKGSQFFSAESRMGAGLSEDYVEHLRVAGGSRGRVPDYFFFNPQCEIEEQFDELSRSLKTKISDLEPLLLWLAQEDDLVELSKEPPIEWQKEVFALKGELPEIVTSLSDLERNVAIERVCPWGWGKSAFKKLKQLEHKGRTKNLMKPSLFSEKLFSKAWWKRELGTPGWIVAGADDFARWLEEARNRTERAYLFKVSNSTSGRGHFVLTREELETTSPRKIGQGVFVVEPFYEKIIDFSVQYEISADGSIKAFEPRFFKIDARFQYQGAYLGSGFGTPLAPHAQLLKDRAKEIKASHGKVLEILQRERYVGPVGIDALIYQNGSQIEIAPVIEVNARMTMGRVALEIERTLRKKTGLLKGEWVFINQKDLAEKFGCESFEGFRSFLESKVGAGNVIATTPLTSTSTAAIVILSDHFSILSL